jgi:hypothetical protein
MNADPENSLSLSIIRQASSVNRTIGVITKADLMSADQGSVTQWLDIIQGRKHPVGHGYFVTSREPNVPLAVASAKEEAFFRDRTKWPRMFEGCARTGVDALKAFVSKKLGDSFADRLVMTR